MSDLVEFNSAQAEQMHHLREMWPEYGHSLQVAAAFSGGMGWKKVKGAEYLVRYFREDGKKKFFSYGRRSAETEATFKHFEDTAGRARKIIKDQRGDFDLCCRLAKAHGLARLPGRQAAILDWFWYTGVTDRLSLFGGAALLAYEIGAGALASISLTKDGHLQFIAKTGDVEALNLDEIVEACDVDRTGCTAKRGRGKISIITSDGDVRAEIFLPQFFFYRAKDEREADPYFDAIEHPRWIGLTVARDNRAVSLTAVHPQVYAVLAKAFGNDPIWSSRAAAANEMNARIPTE
ncbi:hypothetical protein Nham_2086 [Nitrobacter hamburgensis X14]|uniref:Uncharacterized protein n=1 Tax=Nitrobacter hamburgensis (strain DSM 10229 / NCIMB 13809 / X14) TaxID=323097 RepID=Q1QLL4_NITHX|nr:hypothetical protein [Nitrobacter hamburgensis]ABE62883.1 hypothetical protein Nham_2086 [Nitrobacter hamburgensis X14]